MIAAAICVGLAALGQVRETAIAGERLGKALKVTGRYKNVGKEPLSPEFKVLVYDANHDLLASGLTVLEPRTIRAGGMATMTGLILELPAGAEYCVAVMVLNGDEVEPLGISRVPLTRHARDVLRIAATVDHIAFETKEDIFRAYFERLPEAVAPAEKLPRSRRESFVLRAAEKLRREIAKEFHVTAKDVANVVRLGEADGWEKPGGRADADEEDQPFW